MPIYSVQGPDGKTYDIEGPAGASEQQIITTLQQHLAEAPAPAKQPSVLESGARGFESAVSASRTGLASLLGGNESAQAGLQRQEDIANKYGPEAGWEDVKKAYQEKGLLPAIGEYARQVPHALAEQAPQIAASMAGARVGAATPVPGGALLGAAVPSYMQQYGGFLESQAEEQKAKGQPVDVSRTKAALAAIPATAIDVAETFIPMGKGIVKSLFGPGIEKMLARGATEQAEKIAASKMAKEGFWETLGKGTAKGAAVEIPGEVAQQFIERAQAGKSLFDQDALAEYGETAFKTSQMAPIGAYGRFSDKGTAQTQLAQEKRDEDAKALAQQQQADQAKAQQDAQQQAAYRETPEYLADIQQRYSALQTQLADLDAQGKAKVESGDFAGQAAKRDARKAANELRQSDDFTNTVTEFRQAQPRIQAYSQERAANANQLQTQEALHQMRQTPGYQASIPGMEMVEHNNVPPAPEVAAEEQPDYAHQARVLNDQIDLLREKAKTTTSIDEKIALGEQHAQLQKALKEAQELSAKATKPAADQVALLSKKMAIAEEEGDIDTQVALAKKLKELGVGDTAQAQQQLTKQATIPLQPFEGKSETKGEFSIRTRKPAPQAADLEEQALLEESRARDEADLLAAQKEQKLAPEIMALRGMSKPQSAVTRLGNLMYEPMGKPMGTQGSAAVAQMEQQLRGVKPGEESLPTAEEEKAPEERKFQKGPGFGLTNLQGELTRPSDYNNIAERLARVLSEPGLSQDAYAFLRRAEKVLPVLDHKIETARMSQDKAGVKRDVTTTEGVLSLLDQQLTKVERGIEGIGAAPKVAPHEKNLMGFNIPAPRRVIQGPSAKGAPLSMQAEIEPLVKGLEKAAEEPSGQGELFGTEDLGTIRSTRSAFIQASRSKAANKGREEAAAEKAAAVSPAAKAREARVEETAKRNKANEELLAKAKEDRKAIEAMHGEAVTGEQHDAITQAQRLAREGKNGLTPAEKAIAGKNPLKVLARARGDETKLMKQIQASQKQSRGFRLKEAESLLPKIAAMEKAYKKAGAAEREAMMPKLMDLERKYAVAANAAAIEDVQWPGRAKDIKDLETAIRKVMALEELVNSGKVALPEEEKKRKVTIKPGTKLKQEQAIEANQQKVQEAKGRVGATVIGKQSAPKSPLREQRLKAIRDYYKAQIEEKQASGKQLNPFDENFLIQAAKADAVAKMDAKEAKKKAKALKAGTAASETTSAQQDMLSDAAKDAVADGDLLTALADVAKNSKEPFIRETAAKLQKLVARTRISISPELTVKGKAVPAAYNSQENMIGIRPGYETEANLIHEAVHAATMRALEGPVDKLTPDQLAAKNELTAMFKRLKADGTLTGEYAAEDVKEFASEVQSNANLRNKMEAKPWFGSNMMKRALNAFMHLIGWKKAQTQTQAAQDLIERLYMQSGKLNAAVAPAAFGKKENPTSNIVGYAPSKLKTLTENLFGLSGRVQLIDRLAAADAGIIKAEGAGKLSSTEAFQAQYFMRLADSVSQAAGQFITHGPVGIVSEKTKEGTEHRYQSEAGANLVNMAQSVEDASQAGGVSSAEAERMLTVAIAGERAESMPNGWQRLMGADPAAAKAEYEADKQTLASNPAMKRHIDAAKAEYKRYNDGLMDFAAQTGFITKEEATRLKKQPYVPFYRIEDGVVKLFTDKEHAINIGSIKDNPDLERMLGDTDKILPILTGAAQNTFMIARAGLKNKATHETSNALYKAGFASKFGQGTGPANADTVRFKVDGVDHFATIDTDTFGIPAHLIVKGMEGIKTTLPAVVQMMGVPANMLRKFITRNPAYAVRQLVRDPVNAYLMSGVDGVPIVNALKEMRQMKGGRSKAEESLMRGLSISSNVYSGNEKDMEMFLRDISAGKSKWDKLMGAADTLALQADAATRATIYNDSIAKGMSEAQAQFRAMESQNFSRRGLSPGIQMLSTMIPFFNAQIQGLDVLYRSLTNQMPFAQRLDVQRKIKARALMAMTGAMVYALMMSDDEAYKKAAPEERYGNFFVYLPGVEDPVKLPVPFEIGVLTMGIPQAIVNAASSDTKASEAVKGIAKLLWQSAPGVVPAATKPFLEAAYGETMFGPIESAREKETLQAGERYRSETTELAKVLGGITGEVGVSPLMVEHFVKGYTGSLGISAMHLLDPILGGSMEKAETHMNKAPFVGGLFQSKEGRFLVDRAYARMEDVVQAKGTYESLLAKGEKARAENFAQRYSEFLAQADMAGSFKQRMGQMFKDERAIRDNPDMKADEKNALLKRIKEAENNEAMGFYSATDKTTRP